MVFSQVSTFLLSNRPTFITKSCYLLACILTMDGEERVGGGWVKWRRLCACKQVVDRYLRGPRDLQLLEVRLVVLLLLLLVVLLHQLVQKCLVLLWCELLRI